MIVSSDEVVGLCGYHRPPAGGEVEIGYGVAESRRGRGHATRAVEAMATEAAAAGIHVLFAETSIENPASGRVLEKNGFTREGTRIDAEDGEVQAWRKRLAPQHRR
jgi:RimJ/RimL family protein N-acetyltransferase